MSDTPLSQATRALLDQAKGDAFGAEAHARVWRDVSCAVAATAALSGVTASGGSATTGASPAAAGATGAAATGAGKLLTVATLFGAPATVGLAAVLLHAGLRLSGPLGAAHAAVPERTLVRSSAPPAARVTVTPALPPGPRDESPVPVDRNPVGPAGDDHGAAPQRRPGAGLPTTAVPATALPSSRDSALEHEAELVAQARQALLRGSAEDSLRALALAQAAGSPHLLPEELALKAQALRSLGREKEAGDVEILLRAAYPDSVLAR